MNTLTQQTLTFLKNFSGINKNLLIKEGNILSTISEANNIMAFATVDETFDQEFGFYDLTEFLGAYELLNEPTLELSPSHMTLKSGRAKIKYTFADASILKYPEKKLKMPPADLTLNISNEDLGQIKKAAAALGHNTFSVKSDKGKVFLAVTDPKKKNLSNTFELEVEGVSTDATFDLHFTIINLKLIPGNYVVDISSRLISNWKHESEPVEYYIALEKTSTYTQ